MLQQFTNQPPTYIQTLQNSFPIVPNHLVQEFSQAQELLTKISEKIDLLANQQERIEIKHHQFQLWQKQTNEKIYSLEEKIKSLKEMIYSEQRRRNFLKDYIMQKIQTQIKNEQLFISNAFENLRKDINAFNFQNQRKTPFTN